MKHLHPARSGAILFFVFLSLFFISCNPAEEDLVLTYPVTYKYEKLDLKPSKFYVLTGTSYTEIAPAGFYTSFDSLFKDAGFLEITQTEFPFEKIELISESKANVTFFDYLNYPVSSLLTDYSFDQTSGDFVLVGVTDTIGIAFAADYSAVTFPLFTTQYAHTTASGDIDYSPTRTDNGITDIPAAIAALRQKWSLVAGDTVVVNVSGYLYLKQ